MEDRIIRKPIVQGDTTLSSSQIDREEQAGNFPKRRQITERIVGWSFNEVQAWIQNRLHGESEALDTYVETCEREAQSGEISATTKTRPWHDKARS